MTTHPAPIPTVELAIITGSASWGLAFPEDVGVAGVQVLARDIVFETPYGRTENWKLLGFDGTITRDGQPLRALCMYSHGNPRDQMDHACHRRAFWVLREAGVKRVIACSTVGAVNRAIRGGDLVIAADIIEPTQTPYSLLPGRQRYDASGKQIVCAAGATILAKTATRRWPTSGRVHGIEQGLVAAHVYGPRLTTPAEAMMFRTLGADIVNHSIAPEATLSREIGACFTPCAFVTATLNDYLDQNRGTLLQPGVLEDLSQITSRIALETAAALPIEDACSCHALLTPQPPERYTRY